MSDRFWLSDAWWAAIEPLLPWFSGKPRVNNRRVISGILHRSREGLRGRTVPGEYGPRRTLFNRFDRSSREGIWQVPLAACEDPPEIALVDSTTVRAHRSAAGANGDSTGSRSGARAAVRPPSAAPLPTEPSASMP